MAWQTRVEMQRQTLDDCHQERRRCDRERRARHKAALDRLETEVSTLRSKLIAADDLIKQLLEQTQADALTLKTVRETCRVFEDELDKSKKVAELHQNELLHERAKTTELAKMLDSMIRERDDWVVEKQQYQQRQAHQEDQKILALQKETLAASAALEQCKSESAHLRTENELLKSNNAKLMELLHRHVLLSPTEVIPSQPSSSGAMDVPAIPESNTSSSHRSSGCCATTTESSQPRRHHHKHHNEGVIPPHTDPAYHSHCIHRCTTAKEKVHTPQQPFRQLLLNGSSNGKAHAKRRSEAFDGVAAACHHYIPRQSGPQSAKGYHR